MRIWLDSTLLWSPRKAKELCALARSRGFEVGVSAQIHLEQLRRDRTRRGPSFDPAFTEQYLSRVGISIQPLRLDRPTAERWGQRLHERFGSSDAWPQAKLRSLRAKLGDGATLSDRAPMTTDWLVALQVEDDGDDALVVTDDGGPEWDALRAGSQARTYDDARAWLTSLPERA